MAELASMPQYEAYKDSGFDWLGQIPESWELRRFKYLLDEINERSESGQEDLLSVSQYTGVTKKRDKVKDGDMLTNAESLDGYKKVSQGDLVSNIMLAWNGSLGVSPFDGITSPAYAVYRFRTNSSERFYHYLLRTEIYKAEFKRRSSGVIESRLRLYSDDFFDVIGIFPPIYEQIAITKFLDEKTAQIDEAIAIKEKQIALLKERKQIIIQQAVTQGLNPDAPMKDSGVEWIGYIPEHWEVRRSKFLFTQRKERAWKTDVQLSATQAYGVIPQSEYEALSGNTVVKIQFHLDKRKHVEKDDFVISMRSFQGGLERAWSSGCIRSSYVVLKPLEEINPDFYGYLLKLPSYIKALQRTGNFIRDGQDLNFDNFSQVDLFIPPLEEQKAIAEYVKEFMVSSDKGIELLQQQIEKLKEYKTTLINSAVIGKIKVPGVV